MKWWEVMDDLGDGTTVARRFRTEEEARAWREKMEENPFFQCDGDGSPVNEVDTDSTYFFHTDSEFD